MMKTPKVLVNTPSPYGSGGVANYYRILNIQSEPSVDYFYINDPHKTSVLHKVFGLFLLYLKFITTIPKYDLCHLNVSLGFRSYYRDMGFIFLCRLFSKKYIVFWHGWEYPFEAKLKSSFLQRFLFKMTYSKMHGCLLSGNVFKQRLLEFGMNPNCQYFIETMIADDRFVGELDIPKKIKTTTSSFNILFLTRIEETKGVYIAIDAFKQLQTTLADADAKISLTIAGDGPEYEKTQEYVLKKQIEGIEFTGYVKDRVKHEVLAKAHIFLFPTFYPEGVPSVNLEAMLYGLPVISRINAGIPDVVTHGENGFLSESKDPEVFSKFLFDLISQPDLYKQIAFTNHKKAKNHFVKDRIKERILNIYEKI